MGWYNSLKKKTKGLKRMSRDIGRILSGKETEETLDNASKAADVFNKGVGGAVASAAINAADSIAKQKKSKKSKKSKSEPEVEGE